jgi:hypothetical protein
MTISLYCHALLTSLQLALAQLLWQIRNYQTALDGLLSLKLDSLREPPDGKLLSEIQAIVCQCEHALGIFTHTAPPAILGFWKNALDKCSSREEDMSVMSMWNLKAAWRDEYWNLAQVLFFRLSKEYPKEVQYHFAWVAFSQLVANTAAKDDIRGQTNGIMALKSLQIAMKNTLEDNVSIHDWGRVVLTKIGTSEENYNITSSEAYRADIF